MRIGTRSPWNNHNRMHKWHQGIYQSTRVYQFHQLRFIRLSSSILHCKPCFSESPFALASKASSRCCRLAWSDAQDICWYPAGKLGWDDFIGLIFLSRNFIPCSFKHLSHHENTLEENSQRWGNLSNRCSNARHLETFFTFDTYRKFSISRSSRKEYK